MIPRRPLIGFRGTDGSVDTINFPLKVQALLCTSMNWCSPAYGFIMVLNVSSKQQDTTGSNRGSCLSRPLSNWSYRRMCRQLHSISRLSRVCHMCCPHLNANVLCLLANANQAAQHNELRCHIIALPSWHLSPTERETCTGLACWRSFCRVLAALLLFFMHKGADSGPAARKGRRPAEPSYKKSGLPNCPSFPPVVGLGLG